MELLEITVNLPLPPLPSFSTLDQIKAFSTGLIEGVSHPWDGKLEALKPTSRFSVYHSLFLFRKVIPAGSGKLDQDKAVHKMLDRLSEPAPPVSPSFLRFVEKEIVKLFPRGWDRFYRSQVDNFTISTGACKESGRKKGGARAYMKKMESPSELRRSLQRVLLGVDADINIGPEHPVLPECKVVPVADGGKVRVVTVNDFDHHGLRPLHSTLYNHLSCQPWLLRGEAAPSRFKDFTEVPGEVFVSGDYEAATDNIPLELYQFVLQEVAKTSWHVPSWVWEEAKAYSQMELVSEGFLGVGRRETQKRGQLMGSFLSFPFLCLINYLIFRYHIRRPVPVKINGDDIVFRATVEEAERWMEGVGKCGLVLSRGKTLINKRYFSLNSAMFRAQDKSNNGEVCWVPFIRSKPFFSRPSDLSALSGQYESFIRHVPVLAASTLRARFLRRNFNLIARSQRSVTRGLGLRASERVLRLAGMWEREKHYLSLVNEKPLPTPPSDVHWDSVPDGWRKVPRYSVSNPEEHLEQFLASMIDKAWEGSYTLSPDNAEELYWQRVRQGTYLYTPKLRVTVGRGAKLLRSWIGSSQWKGSPFKVRPRQSYEVELPPREDSVWVPDPVSVSHRATSLAPCSAPPGGTVRSGRPPLFSKVAPTDDLKRRRGKEKRKVYVREWGCFLTTPV